MGLTAELVAIGPFSPALIPWLRHPSGLYAGTKPGRVIIEPLFVEAGLRGNASSEALAQALGVEPWDFRTHAVDPVRVDLEALPPLVGAREFERFVGLRDAGWTFYFRPNG